MAWSHGPEDCRPVCRVGEVGRIMHRRAPLHSARSHRIEHWNKNRYFAPRIVVSHVGSGLMASAVVGFRE
jgi:hypothetical protein